MATYLLVWNPNRWTFDELPALVEQVNKCHIVEHRWSCGVNKRIQRGDRVFLIRVGREPKGIFASATVVKGSYESTHWLADKAKEGQKALFVDITFEVLLNPMSDTILSIERLNEVPFSEVNWSTRGGGITVPDQVAYELEQAWAKLTSLEDFRLPEETADTNTLHEGAKKIISVNAYERNPQARKKCIEKYGTLCSVCELSFAKKYGEIGEGFIHVHHLKPLYEIDEEYIIDPIRDMRPVCPNCHAMIHSRKPPYSIEEIKEFLRQLKGI